MIVRGRLSGDREMEGRALAGSGALCPHRAAHHFGQPPADGQAETGAAVFAGDGRIYLTEGLEQAVETVRGNADAGVSDGEMEGDVLQMRGIFFALHRYHHFARFGKLDCVAQEVGQDLAQACDVADNGRWHIRGHLIGQVEFLLTGLDAQQVQCRLHALAQVEGLLLQLHLAGLDLGEVQDVIDDGQQGIPTAADRLGEVALLASEGRVEQQAAHADDGIHRGANLVAHGGQERALSLCGSLGGFFGLAQFFLCPHALGDITIQADGEVAVSHFSRRSTVFDDVLFLVRAAP